MKPLIKYRGGKLKEIPTIEQYIPHFEGRYIEPFFGGGALYFHLAPQRAIINDINSKLMAFYQGIRDNFDVVKQELDTISEIYESNQINYEKKKAKAPDQRIENKNEELYYRIRNMFNGIMESEYTDALLYYFINKTAYSGMIRYNAKGEYNVPFGRYKHLTTSNVTTEYRDLLQNTEIFNGDYGRIFDMANEEDFIFLDPPYDCVFSDYGNEEYKDGFNEEAHIQLAERYRQLNCPSLLVIGKTPLTERLYGDMIIAEYEKKYAVNIRNRFKSSATHILVANYQL